MSVQFTFEVSQSIREISLTLDIYFEFNPVMRIRLFQENGFFAPQHIFYIAGMSKLRSLIFVLICTYIIKLNI